MSSHPESLTPKIKLNGLILINKEPGVTSHDVVFSLRKILKEKQVGHIGTLDPMAEGLLVCLIGEAVKLSDYMMGSDKKYRLTLKMGVETDTWDITGKILKTVDAVVADEVIRRAVFNLSDLQSLPIPMYSAKKIDGKKLYEVARKASATTPPGDNQETLFEGPLKEMKFWDLQITKIQYPFVSLEFQCSKGSFVRSWVYSLGRQLGVGAALTRLERLSIGEFQVKDAVTLEKLRSAVSVPGGSVFTNSAYFLDNWHALQKRTIIELEAVERDKLKSGLVSYMLLDRIEKLKLKGEIFCFYSRRLVGILFASEVVEVKRIFVDSVD